MFKIFWITQDDELPKDGLEVEIMENEEEILDEEVGQVALDVLESSENVFIIAPVSGVEYEDIDVSIHKTILTIKWHRDKTPEYNIEGVIIRNSECFWGKFVRNVILPENLAINKIKAYMQNNLLVITIPKLKFDTKNIKINKVES